MQPEGPPEAEKTWTEALDPGAAGRVLAALDEPEAPTSEPEGDGESGGLPSIDGYVIDRRIGGGGGGDVFRAVRVGSDRPLAIKLLNQRLGENHESRRAWRELDVLGQLRLPAVPRLLDHGVHDGRLFLVTEFIDGAPLVEYCESRGLSREARVELLVKVAEAVQSLHEYGVIHRDIKPSNILVEERNLNGNGSGESVSVQPMLIDLGIATLLSGDVAETLTAAGAPLGSPAFMAPEQARGDKELVSTRSDVYGLGATAYVVLTGQTPYDMNVTLHEAIRRVAQEPPRGPRELDPTLPKPLAAILAKAVSPKPADRYASPIEFGRDLRRWLKGEPVEAGGLSLIQRLGGVLGRHPIVVTTAVCVLIVAATIVTNQVAVWRLNCRPHEIQIDPVDSSWLRLVSLGGRVLKEWDTGVPDGIRFARIVDDEFAGRRMVLIGFGIQIDLPEFDGELCAFDLRDTSKPIWRSGTGPPAIVMPPPISNIQGERFKFVGAVLEDVFDKSPGQELVCVHGHMPHSAYLIRVVATDGTVLYEAWHDGRIDQPYWMSDARQLIFCGISSEATWSQRGLVEEPGSRNPLVVFAIEPKFRQLHNEWIQTPGGKGTLQPAWYRCVLPSTCMRLVSGSGGMYLNRPDIFVSASSHVRLALNGTEPPYVALGLFVNEHGEEVNRFVGDSFKPIRGLPGPDDFRLAELPPIVAEDAGPSR